MSTNIIVRLNEKLYLRNPEDSELGRKIVVSSIKLIDELGFENFTFKKLAQEIQSTEASMYKYFQNKHKLLVYLISWYWVWLDFKINFEIHNIKEAEERLKIVIKIISESHFDDPYTYIDESKLHKIVVSEAAKVYLTKDVDENNKDGLFREYKKLCKKISDLILELCPDHPYSHSLVSTAFETAHQQLFFAYHLPSLSDVKKDGEVHTQVANFLEHLVFSSIAQFNCKNSQKKGSN